MKYSDGFFQKLCLIRPSAPKRSTEMVEALIERYDLSKVELPEPYKGVTE